MYTSVVVPPCGSATVPITVNLVPATATSEPSTPSVFVLIEVGPPPPKPPPPPGAPPLPLLVGILPETVRSVADSAPAAAATSFVAAIWVTDDDVMAPSEPATRT